MTRFKALILIFIVEFSLLLILSINLQIQKTKVNHLFSNSPKNMLSGSYFSRAKETEVLPQITIDSIFFQDHNWVATLAAEKVRVLVATGDLIPARAVNYKTVTTNNFSWPYIKTQELLKSGDITIANLESPLTKVCPKTLDGMKFCGDEKNVEGLAFSGINVVNLANNHSTNFGFQGLKDTENILKHYDIIFSGTEEIAYKNIKGLRFSFLGYNDIGGALSYINAADGTKIRNDLIEARRNSDVVVVSFHWGTEYTGKPSTRQKYLAHLAIDNGADLVIGNHPHHIQPVEVYNQKVVIYAHGNFVFDQMWSEDTKKGVIGRYTFYDKRLVDTEFIPIYIEDFGQPRLMAGREKEETLKEMWKESADL